MVHHVSGLPASVWIAVGTHLWQTTLVVAVLLVIARLMRRAPAAFLNALLWVGLVKLLVPMPLLKAVVGDAIGDALRMAASSGAASRVTLPLIDGSAAVLDPTDAVLNGTAGMSGNLPLALTVLWVAGALAVAMVLLARSRPWRDVVIAPASAAPEAARMRLGRALSAAAIPDRVVGVTGSRVVPHVTGILRPRIVLPLTLIEQADDDALRGVLLHEDAHRRRREPLRLLLSRAAAVAFFFYPLLWPLLRWLRETGEMACDEAALARGVRPGSYARTLAALLDMELTAAPSSAALDRRRPSLLRRRLARLREPWRYTMNRGHRVMLTAAVAAVMLSSVLALSSIAGDVTTEAKAPPPPDKPLAPPPQEPAPPPEPSDFLISYMVPPEYPEEAKAQGLEAIVFLTLTLAEDGSIAKAEERAIVVGRPPLEIIKMGDDGRIVEPAEEEGMDAYHAAFLDAAIGAALQWKIETRPENAWIDDTQLVVPIQFRLDGDSEEPERSSPDEG
jgi:beta-lactamase regulating signal transducer with metallopeptidase domain